MALSVVPRSQIPLFIWLLNPASWCYCRPFARADRFEKSWRAPRKPVNPAAGRCRRKASFPGVQ